MAMAKRGILTYIIATTLLFTMSYTAFGQDSGSIETLRQTGKAFAKITEKASPAVVGIKSEKTVKMGEMGDGQFGFPVDPFGDDFFEQFFNHRTPRHNRPQRQPREMPKQQSQGSGFIISADGFILTNNHVVDGAEKVTVLLGESKELDAKIIGTDPASDIAVIKIDVNNLPFLEMADSDKVEVGEWVLAIGNPFGLNHTVTAGIISAKGRSGIGLAKFEDFMQTDAAINPGNSGGPLINLDCQVIGINTAIIGPGGNIGIGLVIPINMAKNISEQLRDGGKVVRGYLGVYPQDLTSDMAKSFELSEDTKGVLIPQVDKDTPADKAGLKKGDIIIEVDGKAVEKADVFRNKIAMSKPGTKVELTVLRDGDKKKIEVELGERPKDTKEGDDVNEDNETLAKLGVTVESLNDETAEKYGLKNKSGVVVSDVERGSIAQMAGIQPGMVIEEVNGTEVNSTKEFTEGIDKAGKQGNIRLLINTGKFRQYILLKLPKDKK